MWKTVLLLIFTLIVVPIVAFFFEPPLSSSSQTVLRQLVYIYLIAALLCFVVSTLADNYSQVDKLWSIMPIIYAWCTAQHFGFEPRLVLMAALVTLWGLRLTYNFSRRGGYSWKFWQGEQDYRWAEVRKRPGFGGKWAWMLFNLAFISLYQMGLILLFTLPIVKAGEGAALGWLDALLATLFVILVIVQANADNQQLKFQQHKYRLIDAGADLPTVYADGFIRSGLWAKVRHPNYACEQGCWIVFYLFSIAATGQWLNWSITGALLLVILFKNSSDLSEEISSGKYPKYQEYINSVPRFVPNLFK